MTLHVANLAFASALVALAACDVGAVVSTPGDGRGNSGGADAGEAITTPDATPNTPDAMPPKPRRDSVWVVHQSMSPTNSP